MNKTRFNLLVITDDASFGKKALRAVSKSYRRNFIFEVQNRLEAQKLLERLHIDMILVDLDYHRIHLADLAEQYPDTPVVGVASSLSQLDVNPGEALVFTRGQFAAQLITEIKEMKKGNRPEKISVPKRVVTTPSFDNYSTLLSV